jgi:hypothetical protein
MTMFRELYKLLAINIVLQNFLGNLRMIHLEIIHFNPRYL